MNKVSKKVLTIALGVTLAAIVGFVTTSMICWEQVAELFMPEYED